MKIRVVRDILPNVIDRLSEPKARMPVRNREPRIPMGGHKWHLIWERDGGICWLCGRSVPKGTGEVDHVIPRSSFAVDQLDVADRSDNLRTACVNCNQAKSNFRTLWGHSTVGVTAKCWECANPTPDPEIEFERYREWQDARPEMTFPAYCARCGYTWVPDARWLL